MFKYGLYLCCLAGLILFCACGKREMTRRDVAAFETLIEKYDAALRKNDYQSMLNCAKEISDFVNRFPDDKEAAHLRCEALFRFADAYCIMGHTDRGMQFYDEAFRIAPDSNTQLTVLRNKIFMSLLARRIDDAEQSLKKAYELLEQEENTDSYKTDFWKRQIFLNHREKIILRHGSLLIRKKQYREAEKLYLEFLSRFRTETDFRNLIPEAVLFYSKVSGIYHHLRNPEKELYYLNHILSIASDDQIYFTSTHLRLAAFALRDKNYVRALQLCDMALVARSHRMSEENIRQFQAMLLNAKAEIYKRMKKKEEAEKILKQSDAVLTPDLKDYLDWILFDF